MWFDKNVNTYTDNIVVSHAVSIQQRQLHYVTFANVAAANGAGDDYDG